MFRPRRDLMLTEKDRRGMNAMDGTVKPIPDPTVLTTEQIFREVYHLRELIEARLDQMDDAAVASQIAASKAVEAAQVASDKAIEAALAASDKAVMELGASIQRQVTSLVELTDSKFVTYRTLLDSQSEKVALALSAADKAVSKAEQYNNQQFSTITDKIDDLKEYRAGAVGERKGGSELWVLLVGVATLLVSVILVGLRLTGG